MKYELKVTVLHFIKKPNTVFFLILKTLLLVDHMHSEKYRGII